MRQRRKHWIGLVADFLGGLPNFLPEGLGDPRAVAQGERYGDVAYSKMSGDVSKTDTAAGIEIGVHEGSGFEESMTRVPEKTKLTLEYGNIARPYSIGNREEGTVPSQRPTSR